MQILELELEDGRFKYVQVERRENVALYTQTHKASGHVRMQVLSQTFETKHYRYAQLERCCRLVASHVVPLPSIAMESRPEGLDRCI